MKTSKICAVCRHPERVEIEKAVAGQEMSLRAAVRHWDLHYTQAHRHMTRHYPLGREVDPEADQTCGEYSRITDEDRARVAAEVAAAPPVRRSQSARTAPESEDVPTPASAHCEAIQPVSAVAVEVATASQIEPANHPRAIDSVRDLRHRIDRVMRDAEVLGNHTLILQAAREIRQVVELEARLTGEARQAEGAGVGPVTVVIRKDFGPNPKAEPTVIDVTPPAD